MPFFFFICFFLFSFFYPSFSFIPLSLLPPPRVLPLLFPCAQCMNLVVLSHAAADVLLSASVGPGAGMQVGDVSVFVLGERFHGEIKAVDVVVQGEVGRRSLLPGSLGSELCRPALEAGSLRVLPFHPAELNCGASLSLFRPALLQTLLPCAVLILPSIDTTSDSGCVALLSACALLTIWRAAALARDDLRDRLVVGPSLGTGGDDGLEALLLAEASAGILHSSGSVDVVDAVGKLRNSRTNLCKDTATVEFVQR